MNASAVFHNELREFVSDLLRLLFLMHAYLKDFGDLPVTEDYPQSSLHYFDEALKNPERSCSQAYLRQVASECRALYQRMGDMGAARYWHPLISMSLLRMCEHAEALLRAINCPDREAILAVAECTTGVHAEQLESGWLIVHSELSRGTLCSFYENLMDLVVGD